MPTIIPGMENIDWTAIIGVTAYWIGYIIAIVFILVFFVGIYYFFSFNIKEVYWPLYASGEKGMYSLGKRKTNHIKKVKGGNAWRRMFPLFNNKNHEPYGDEFIYAGREVVSYKLGDDYMPAKVEALTGKDALKLSPIPKYLRNWQISVHKEIDSETMGGFWEENKHLIYMVATVAICCALGAFTVWMTYKFASPRASEMSGLTQALETFGARYG